MKYLLLQRKPNPYQWIRGFNHLGESWVEKWDPQEPEGLMVGWTPLNRAEAQELEWKEAI